VELVGGYGRNDRQSVRGIQVGLPPGDSEALYETWSTDFKADGPLFELPGGPVRAALGGSWRSESFRYENRFGQFITNQANEDQRVYSLFGEINVPIVGAANEMQGVRRLELSLAGRYDHYSNFGSSIDPRIGLAWEPLAGLRLRGSYGTSYVAPKLTDYNTSDTAAAALYDLDPSSPFGLSYQIQILGGADTASLRPQKSESFTLGFELTPLAAPGLRLSLGYYDIDYKDQITDVPQFASLILGNPEIYGSLFTRNPTLAQVQQAIDVANAGLGFFALGPDYLPDPNFDPSTVEVIIDGRRRNLARIRTRGLDFSVGYERDIGASHFNLGVEGVYILERRQQVTATSAPIETINTVFNPPELRLRARAGWSSGGWSLNAFANHVGGYTDNRVMPFAQVGSWTTIDANLSYSFGNRQGPLSGVKIALSATNFFDSDPPGVRIINPGGFDMGFDPTNASPLGRLMAIEITKTW
jgi:iron complex outermembrane receptor protein